MKYWKVFLGFDYTDKHQADTRLTPSTTSDLRLSDTLALYGATTTTLNISLRDTEPHLMALLGTRLITMVGKSPCDVQQSNTFVLGGTVVVTVVLEQTETE